MKFVFELSAPLSVKVMSLFGNWRFSSSSDQSQNLFLLMEKQKAQPQQYITTFILTVCFLSVTCWRIFLLFFQEYLAMRLSGKWKNTIRFFSSHSLVHGFHHSSMDSVFFSNGIVICKYLNNIMITWTAILMWTACYKWTHLSLTNHPLANV
jgi:hypothetical protein